MIFWIVWLAIGFVLVVLSAAFVLPRIMRKAYAATLPIRDRLTGKAPDEHGTVLLFEPAPSVRQYIKSYRVARDSAGLYFCGEWNRKVAFIKYQLVVYNASNNIVNVLRVKEKFNDGNETHRTRLPKNTDFVTLHILRVDDTPVRVERKPFNLRYVLWLALFCVLLAATVDLLVWVGLTAVLRIFDNFAATLAVPVAVWAEVLGFAALGVIVFTLIFALVRLFLTRRRGEV